MTWTKTIQLRLHLVRHGETIANLQNNVIGQSDSPLTELGKQQVRALGKWLSSTVVSHNQLLVSDGITNNNNNNNNDDDDEDHDLPTTTTTNNSSYFWRIYSSDLGRTMATTQILLLQEFDSNNCSNSYVRYDPRLREIARGLRQGLPKAYTYDEATDVYNHGQHPLYSNNNSNDDSINNTTTSLPILETDDDGWNRIYTLWLTELIQDISALHNDDDDDETETETTNIPYNVLVITHAALLRVFLQRLIGTTKLQQHPEVVYKYDNNNDTGIPINNRLYIPNTSYTVLHFDITIQQQPTSSSSTILLLLPTSSEYNDPQHLDTTPIISIQRVEIERFTSTDHYQFIE